MEKVPAEDAAPVDHAEPDLTERLAGYRRVREGIERNVLPLATSVDGSGFEFQASLHHLELTPAGYVVLETELGPRLGQVTELRVATEDATDNTAGATTDVRVRLARGSGTVLEGERRPFHDAAVRPATPEQVQDWCTRTRPGGAGLDVGELLLAPGTPAILDSAGLNRHTFMCGQSGSGKTYSLGLLLERVLAETRLRVVILDPNSDYVGLPRIRDGADPELARRYAAVPAEVAVWQDKPDAPHPLRLRFTDLDAATQAAVLDLHPIRDADEYAVLTDLLRRAADGAPLVADPEQLLSADTPAAQRLGRRAMNLGVLDWSVWDAHQPSLVEELRHPTTRCTVVDLGSLTTVREQRLVAAATLATLWASRLDRRPCLVVIDEAHNICPTESADLLTRLSTAQAVQIAAEGRKFGLYLLTSTQRPHKVHEEIVSQCDNLLLMRMNSQADLAGLTRLLSFVPDGLMAGATSFRLGQALVGGKVMPRPAYVAMGERVSEEGGADIPTTWASPGATA